MDAADFESRMTPEPNTGCWLWTGSATADWGYGLLSRKTHGEGFAHRMAFKLYVGPIPPGKCVLHRCDNPPCVNPLHLFTGTRGDNARDMAAKGRQWLQRHPERRAKSVERLRSVVPQGVDHANSKLTPEMVLEIRERKARGESHRAIARALGGITYGAVGAVVSGRTWTHVPTPNKKG